MFQTSTVRAPEVEAQPQVRGRVGCVEEGGMWGREACGGRREWGVEEGMMWGVWSGGWRRECSEEKRVEWMEKWCVEEGGSVCGGGGVYGGESGVLEWCSVCKGVPFLQVALNDTELTIENIQKLCASVQVSHGWAGQSWVGRKGWRLSVCWYIAAYV